MIRISTCKKVPVSYKQLCFAIYTKRKKEEDRNYILLSLKVIQQCL